MGVNDLEQVLVCSHHHGVDPETGRIGRQGGNEVIGLISFPADCRDVHLPEGFHDDGNLGVKLIGSLVPRALIGGIHLMTEGLSRAVQSDYEVVEGILPEQHEDGVEKTEECGDVVSLLIGQRTGEEGEIRTVNQGVAVHDEEGLVKFFLFLLLPGDALFFLLLLFFQCQQFLIEIDR